MVDLKYVFKIFNLEKERSALATVTERMANRTLAVANSGIDDVKSELIMKFSMSDTVCVASSSLLNSCLKDRASVCHASVLHVADVR